MMSPLARSERWLAEVAIVAIVGCAIALFGWMGTGDMPLGARMAYCVGGCVLAWVLMKGLARAGQAAARLIGIADIWGYAIAIPLGSAVISWSVLWWFGGPSEALGEGFAQIWPPTILVGLGFFGLFYVIYARADRVLEDAPASPKGGAESDENAPARSPQSALHERLPPGFPAILALSVEDHYTRVHASERSEMVLMPLSEAIGLMPEGQGEQVHRSWWAARAAVSSHRREGRDVKLTLRNGLEVPVSRTKVKPLREAGWLN